VTERRTKEEIDRYVEVLRRRSDNDGPCTLGGRAASAPCSDTRPNDDLRDVGVGRSAYQLRTTGVPATALADLIPATHLNGDVVNIAEVSERDLVAHFTRLSHRQFSVDLGMYRSGRAR